MVYDKDSCAVLMSLEELCSLSVKSGSIDTGAPGRREAVPADGDALAQIAAQSTGEYRMNLPFADTRVTEGICYTVTASADGVFRSDGEYTVDTVIKVEKYDFYMPPSDIAVAKLKCCCLFFAGRMGLDTVRGRIVYVGKDNGKIKSFGYSFCVRELEEFYLALLGRVAFRARICRERAESVLPDAADCPFPYEGLRDGQDTMIRECYGAIKHGGRLFVQAPTGIGKTSGALYPAVRALGAGFADRIFYLTCKASTGREAYKAAGAMFAAGAKLRTVMISAKESVCLCPTALTGAPRGDGSRCNPIDCPYANGYYDRIEAALESVMGAAHGYTRQLIAETAKKFCVCPYELSLDISELCDIIICDYNYVFDPFVYFRRYFPTGGAIKENYVFLVDEAHNLVDRAREMYSAEIHSRDIEAVYSKVGAAETELNSLFEKVIYAVRALRRLCRDTLSKDAEGNESGFWLGKSPLTSLYSELDIFRKKCDSLISKNREHPLYIKIRSLLALLRRFVGISEYFDERFVNYVYINKGDICVRIFCMDPSDILDRIQKRARASLMFSATLTPPEYFSDVLGGRKNPVLLSLPSPFDSANLCVTVAGYASMRYGDREKNSARFATVIAATVSAKPGNYIAYFPSYDVLESVYGAFVKKYPKVKTVLQHRGMDLRRREEFLDAFKNDSGVLRVGFCVLGGSFSEGVDLPGGRLIGAVVFGVGLPGLSDERNIIREYYDSRGESGYDYAYTYPGMNNVLQAAGRVIRRDDDRGVVVLVDDRYAEPKYRELFPAHWKDVRFAGNSSELAEIVRDFWLESPNA
ncbi:MAG: ATP-dependent DNA helicase [Eubacteriales bacterium]